MHKLYHYSLCPFSRKARVVMREKGVEFELISENFWERRTPFLKLNPAGELPILITPVQATVAGNRPVCQYLEETNDKKPLLPASPIARAEVRRIEDWFDNKFYLEVTKYILNEKILKTVSRSGYPNSRAIQASKHNLKMHLQYIEFLTRNRRYLAGDEATLADFAAAAQISVLDYVGDIPWSNHQKTKDWYALIKSRPSFRPILNELIPQIAPPTHYKNPDF